MHIISNKYIFARITGILLSIISVSFISCVPVAVVYHESIWPFVISAFISLIPAYGFLFIAKGRENSNIEVREAYLIVILSWVLISLAGTFPYLISGAIPDFVNAFFESVSGFTTTGSSILTNIEALPKSILYWRSLTHWIGGIGVITLVIVVFPSFNIGGYRIFTLESSLQQKTHPRIKSVGIRILLIYLGLTVAEIIFLMLGDMNWFESVCHAYGTVATGGFSPKNTSIGGYSPYIQYVVTIFMLLSGTNFIVHYFILTGQGKKVKQNEEFWFYLFVIFISGLLITSILYLKTNKGLEHSFREAFFQVTSIVTCTGFATTDYLKWPHYAYYFIFFLMFAGGSTGSTAGGIKMVRHLVMFKNFRHILQRMNNVRAVHTIRLNNHTLSDEQNRTILAFMVLYLLFFVMSTVVLLAAGIDFQSAASAVATAMGGIGPGIGSVGPASNFSHFSGFAKLFLSFDMISGRLELLTVLVLFSPAFWKR